MKDNFYSEIERHKIESIEKWREIIKEVPTIHFDEEWEVKIIPPFGGAVARFLIEKKGKHVCSVYLDWYEKLGFFGEPYYELYPFNDDVKRYSLKDTIELTNDIRVLFEDAK